MSNTGDTKVTESPKLDVARPDMGMEDGGNREAAAANDTAAKSKGNGGPMGNGKNTASKERASRKQEAADGTATLEPGPERVGKRQEKAARMAEGARRYLQSHGEEGPPSRRSPRSAKHDENGASAKHEETRASAKHDETGTSAKHDGTETSPKVAPIKASSSEKDLTISSNPSAAAKGKAKPVTSAVPSEALAEEDLPQAVRAAFRAQAAAQAQALGGNRRGNGLGFSLCRCRRYRHAGTRAGAGRQTTRKSRPHGRGCAALSSESWRRGASEPPLPP